jgi:hypothetical protein
VHRGTRNECSSCGEARPPRVILRGMRNGLPWFDDLGPDGLTEDERRLPMLSRWFDELEPDEYEFLKQTYPAGKYPQYGVSVWRFAFIAAGEGFGIPQAVVKYLDRIGGFPHVRINGAWPFRFPPPPPPSAPLDDDRSLAEQGYFEAEGRV